MLHCTRQHYLISFHTQNVYMYPQPHVHIGGPRLVWYQPWSHHNQTTKPRSCQGQHVFPRNTKPTNNKGTWQQQPFPLGHTSAFQTCCLNCHYRFPNNDMLTFNGCTSLVPRPPSTMEGGLGMRPFQQWREVWEWDLFNNGGRSGNGTPSTMEGGLRMRPLQHGQCELQRPRGQGLWWGSHTKKPDHPTQCVWGCFSDRHTRPSTIW